MSTVARDTSQKSDGKLIPVCGLWESTSANGARYLAGTLGRCRILIFRNHHKKTTDDRQPDFTIFVTEAAKPQGDKPKQQPDKSDPLF